MDTTTEDEKTKEALCREMAQVAADELREGKPLTKARLHAVADGISSHISRLANIWKDRYPLGGSVHMGKSDPRDGPPYCIDLDFKDGTFFIVKTNKEISVKTPIASARLSYRMLATHHMGKLREAMRFARREAVKGHDLVSELFAAELKKAGLQQENGQQVDTGKE